MTPREFLRRAKAYGRRQKLSDATLSKALFRGDARAIEGLDKALKGARGGPSAARYDAAARLLERLEKAESEEDERVVA